jgi:hypothetical protein
MCFSFSHHCKFHSIIYQTLNVPPSRQHHSPLYILFSTHTTLCTYYEQHKHTEILQNYITVFFFLYFFTALHSFKIIKVYILLVHLTHYILTMVHIILYSICSAILMVYHKFVDWTYTDKR